MWRHMSSIKTEVIKETPQDKQIKIKKRLIESRLEKKILGGGLFILDKIKLITGRIILKFKKVKKKGHKLTQDKKFMVWKKRPRRNLEISDESKLASLILEAQTLLKKKKIDEAEDKFIQALGLDPKNIEVYMGLGEIYVARKDFTTAEEAYRYIVKINNKFLEGYKELSRVFEITKKWDELKKMTEEVLALGHEEAWVYSMLAKSYKRKGYPEEAEKYFKKAVELEPQHEKWLDQLIEVAIANNNKVLAKKAFNTLSQVCRDEIKLQSYQNKIDLL